MVTKNDVTPEVQEVPTFSIALVDKKGAAIDKHVAMRKVLAAEFVVPMMSGDIADVSAVDILAWIDAIQKIADIYDEQVKSLSAEARELLPDVYATRKTEAAQKIGQKTFRKERDDKVKKAVDPEDILG